MKLDTDGEVLVKSEVVMLGYRNLPEKTRETFTEDGWLRTGDIGAFDEDGYLTIVDRKKELIISAAGKNMSPANIEATLKSASPLIGQACCIGDRRPYNTALIVLDADFAPVWAAKQGIEDTSLESLAREERVRAAVQEGVDAANAKLARVEQIKKFTIVEGDWLPGGDELTPTMKLKRKPIAEKYERRSRRCTPGPDRTHGCPSKGSPSTTRNSCERRRCSRSSSSTDSLSSSLERRDDPLMLSHDLVRHRVRRDPRSTSAGSTAPGRDRSHPTAAPRTGAATRSGTARKS